MFECRSNHKICKDQIPTHYSPGELGHLTSGLDSKRVSWKLEVLMYNSNLKDRRHWFVLVLEVPYSKMFDLPRFSFSGDWEGGIPID